jgi:hypothetical protein
MGLRKSPPPTPVPMTLVANSQKEAWLLLLLEAYPRDPVTDRRLAAYLPRVTPFSDDELEAVVNTWLDDPEHTQAPAPGQLKALLERHRQWATSAAAADVPTWQQPPPPEAERPTPEDVHALVSSFLGMHTMTKPAATPRPRRPRGEATTRSERCGELDAQAVALLGKAIVARQHHQLSGEALGRLKQRLRDASSEAELTAIAAEIPAVMPTPA